LIARSQSAAPDLPIYTQQAGSAFEDLPG